MKGNAVSEETEGDKPMTPRRSFWKVGLALFGLVVLLLGGAFALNARLRPAVGGETVGITAGPASPVPSASVPQSTPRAAVAAPATSAVGTLRIGTTPVVPAGIQSTMTPLEQEIETAYLQYWKVRSDAFYTLDPSHLGDVMAGAELARDTKQINDLKAQGKAVKVDIVHHIAFLQVSTDQAQLYDEYLNRSLYVDPNTKQVLPTSAPPETEKISYQMQKISGTWKVVDGAQHN